MTKKELVTIALGLLLLAVLLHLAHYLLFHDLHHTVIYMVGDLAFLPVDIAVLAIIVERLLGAREKRAKEHKLNMVIGAFFSEVGHPLLKLLDQCVPDESELYSRLAIDPKWTEQHLRDAGKFINAADLKITPCPDVLAQLRAFFREHRSDMLRMLENPNLIEHETFTDCLWAVFHLAEELAARPQLTDLPASDMAHLAVDSRRAYVALLRQWVTYMIHLKQDYPYLYSFAVRTNPFNRRASIHVSE